MPVGFRINTRGGDLDIPAGATVHLREEDNHYLGYTPAEVVFEEPAQEPEPMSEPAPAEPEPPAATPAAVAHADELGVDLTQVEGTGSGGTILKADVAAAAQEGATDGETEPSQPEQTPGQ